MLAAVAVALLELELANLMFGEDIGKKKKSEKESLIEGSGFLKLRAVVPCNEKR